MGNHSEGRTAVAIPATGKALANFIGELLGQRRNIEKIFKGCSFSVDLNWLLNLHLMIDQRIVSQNDGSLADFKATIYFDSGRIHNLYGFDAFNSYRDISNEVCGAVEMGWTYLVKFPSKELPEKQEINFRIAVDEKFKERKTQSRYGFFNDYLKVGADADSLAKIEIAYTDFTWGEDIQSHVTRYIDSSFHKADICARFISYIISTKFLPFIGFLLFPIAVLFQKSFFEGDSKATLMKSAQEQLKEVAPDTAIKKLNLLIEMQSRTLTVNEITVFASLFYVIVMFALLLALIGIRAGSFIAINDYSVGLVTRFRGRLTIVHVSIALALFVGISSSVFASKAYELLKAYSIF